MGIEGFFVVLGTILATGLLGSTWLYLLRRRKAAILTAIASLVTAGAWYPLPAVDRIASVLFFPDDTIYAPGFSAGAFGTIRLGQDSHQVLALLGKPLDRTVYSEDATEYWYYSRHGVRYDNYWTKIVVFDARSHRVIRKVNEFYSD